MESRKGKIVHIVESFGGGVYSVLADLINNTSKDFEITILYGQRKETPENFEQDFNKNVKFIKIDNFTRSINLKKDLKAIKEVKQNIKIINPDIVHLHSSKAGIIGRLAVNGRKTKMFYNPHGFSFLKQDDSKIKRIIYWWIEKITAILNKKCTIIGCSQGEYLEAKKLNKNAACINNGINIELLNELTKDLKPKKIDFDNLKVCTVGRIGYQKNPKLFNQIAEAFPNIQFTWIGDGEDKEKRNLTAENISITGWQDKKGVLKSLNDHDIFILCSLWEGMPISLLEAMYIKKICIVSNVIGNRDVIENEKNGYIANDLEQYINLINNIKKDRKNDEVINNAHESVTTEYNTGKMTNEYKERYMK